MFLRKYWLPISVFLVAIAGVGLYLLATQPPPEPVPIYKAVEPEKLTEQPQAEAPVGDTSQDGHVHADGNPWHEEPHEMPETDVIQSEDINFFDEIDAESKARTEKAAADMAAAKTAREFNEAWMRQMEASPSFHGQQNYYNFLKAHPDFDYATASPELKQRCRDALNADTAKVRADAEQSEKERAEYERNRKPVDKSPFIPNQGGNR